MQHSPYLFSIFQLLVLFPKKGAPTLRNFLKQHFAKSEFDQTENSNKNNGNPDTFQTVEPLWDIPFEKVVFIDRQVRSGGVAMFP